MKNTSNTTFTNPIANHKDKTEQMTSEHLLIGKLLNIITEIVIRYQITTADMHEIGACTVRDIENAEILVGNCKHKRTTHLTVALRNGTPLNAFTDRQHAINYCIRTNTPNSRMTHEDVEITIHPQTTMLLVEYQKGKWYYEAYDENTVTDNPRLIIPLH